jgi:hypothetical protein
MKLPLWCLAIGALVWPGPAIAAELWTSTTLEQLTPLDDDIARNASKPQFFDGVEVAEYRFSENGFDWHLIRFASQTKPAGPLWMVPHDDENAAFDAMIAAIRDHGGVGVVVNSGPGSLRRQAGDGTCGVLAGKTKSCDPNRNFDAKTPLFTNAFLSLHLGGQPIIALHTNAHGFSGDGQGGRGGITILDGRAFQQGELKPRADGHFALRPPANMANYDTLGLAAYLASEAKPGAAAVACRQAMTEGGVHFWHERVERSDGSMSNYLALNHPDIAYFNAESREEIDLATAAARHKVMIDTYLAGCVASGDQPAP